MESKAKFLGHSVHQMLVVFPLGLLATAPVFDLIGLIRSNSLWFQMSFWMIAAGLLGGLAAALFGLIDWLAVPRGTRAKFIGLWHGIVNSAVILLFALSWILRRPSPEHPISASLVLSFTAVAFSFVGAWLGGELVDRLGVGIDDGVHLNAPSSLSSHSVAKGSRQSDSKRAA
jgi:uncharacterized membrane protein